MSREVAGLVLDFDASSAPKASAQLRGFQSQNDATAASIGRLGAALPGVGQAMAATAAVAVGLGVAFAAATAASLAQEKQIESLRGAMERSGRSWGDAESAIMSYAAEQQRATGIGDDATQASLAQLVNLTSGIEASTQDLIGWQRLATDISVATGKSLTEATNVVAKAVGGNVEALGELVPGLRDVAREVNATEDASGRAAFALGALDDAFGGAARAANPLGLALDRLKAGAGDFAEQIGALATRSPAVASAFSSMADTVDIMSTAFGESTAAGHLLQEAVEQAAAAGAVALRGLARAAIIATNAIAEIYETATGDEADAITERINAASGAVNTINGYMAVWHDSTQRQTADLDDLRVALRAAADAHLVERDAVEETILGLERRGRAGEVAREQLDRMAVGIQAMVTGEQGLQAQLGATNEAFARRRAEMEATLASLDAPPPAAEQAEVNAPSNVGAARTASARQTSRDLIDIQKQFAIEYAAKVQEQYEADSAALQTAMQQRMDAWAAQYDAEQELQWLALDKRKAANEEAYAAEREALQLELDERNRLAEEAEAEYQRILQRRGDIARTAVERTAAIIQSMEGKSRKERIESLKKAAAQELVIGGIKFTAMGIADIAAQNYAKGAGELVGAGVMFAAAAKFGASGGGKQAPTPAEDVGPQRADRIETVNNISFNWGGGIPQRAYDRAAREASGSPSDGVIGI